jgi:hypothetical protein
MLRRKRIVDNAFSPFGAVQTNQRCRAAQAASLRRCSSELNMGWNRDVDYGYDLLLAY